EIAQSEGASKKPFVKYWLHNEHLLVDGKKMSKSLGNFYTLRDLVDKNLKPLAIRYALISTHYRSQLNFTFDVVHAAEKTLSGIQDFLARLKEADGKGDDMLETRTAETRKVFDAALCDDLDVATALASVFELQHAANKALDAGTLSNKQAQAVASFFWDDFDAVFGVLEKPAETKIPDEINALVKEREAARKARDFKKSDALREQIRSLGYAVDDTGKGTRVKRA
ncbi:MAG: class I tRNA ligase family protein, partial [Candidatus Micrarchaeota archaeon]|nr:class I tRNA ligase family protein [Candidatus Micrarchaeota archaeon]